MKMSLELGKKRGLPSLKEAVPLLACSQLLSEEFRVPRPAFCVAVSTRQSPSES